mgnify:CR=1 FL=1
MMRDFSPEGCFHPHKKEKMEIGERFQMLWACSQGSALHFWLQPSLRRLLLPNIQSDALQPHAPGPLSITAALVGARCVSALTRSRRLHEGATLRSEHDHVLVRTALANRLRGFDGTMPPSRAVRSLGASADAGRVLKRSRNRSEPIRGLPRLAARSSSTGHAHGRGVHSL